MGTKFVLRIARLAQRWQCDNTGDEPRYWQTLVASAEVRGQLDIVGPVGASRRSLRTVELELMPTSPENRARREGSDTHAGQVFLHQSENHLLYQALMTLEVPLVDFDQLWSASGAPVQLTLWSELAGDAVALKQPDSQYGSLEKVIVTRLGLVKGGAEDLEGLHVARARELQELFAEHRFDNEYSQVRRIFGELAEGVAKVENFEERAEKAQAVIDLVSHARRVYREPVTGTGRPYDDNAYVLDKPEFLQFIAPLDAEQQKLLKERYDRLWSHYKLADAIQLGQEKAGPGKDGLRCFAEEIEPLVHDYLALGLPRSATLEWLLMDSLVYSECLGLAQLLHSTKSFFGQPMAVPLEPLSAGKKARKECWRRPKNDPPVRALPTQI